MTARATSLQSTGAWRRFAAFVRRPELPDRATGMRAAAVPVLARLFALDLVLMAGLIVLAAAAVALGAKLPGHMLEGLEMGAPLIFFILVAAPLGEEIAFRGWLSGRPGHLAASGILLLTGFVFLFAISGNPLGPLGAVAAPAAGAVLAAVMLWANRRRAPVGLFRRNFRWFYFGSALAFASVHLVNFTGGAALVLLPLTLPQFLLGLILGYARVQFGLWASILLHAAHNALFLGLVLAGTG